MSNLRKFDNEDNSISSANNFNNIEPLAKIPQQIESSISSISETRLTFLQKVFPDAKTRTIIAGELSLIKTEYEFRHKALEFYRETQLQSFTESCNQYLSKGKAASRADTAEFLLSKKLELQKKIDNIQRDFLKQMELNLQEIESLNHPLLKAAQQQKLEWDLDGFIQLYFKLMKKFEKIISEGV